MKPESFALITGTVVGATGLLGIIGTGEKRLYEKKDDLIIDEGFSRIGGMLPTNPLFNWVRLGVGIVGIFAARNRKSAVIYNRSVAASYAGLAVMGIIPQTKTLFGFLPLFGGNVALHAGTAVAELISEEALMKKAKKLIPMSAKKLRGTKRSSRTSRA